MIAVYGVISTVANNDSTNAEEPKENSMEHKENGNDDQKELQPDVDHINHVQDNLKALELLYCPQEQERLELKETEPTDINCKINAIAHDITQKYNDFTSILSGKDGNYDFDKYPRNRRFSVFVDRRKDKPINGNKDQITIFQPPDDCNKLPPDHVPEIGFELIQKCLIPRPDGHITAKDGICGQLLTFMFHIEQKDEIRCYIVWNGQAS